MIGQVLNERYEILEKIGEGGMAVTYRGRDRLLGRVVAIKLMKPELAADAEFLARFRREARAAAGITHEHIASVHDTGSDGPYHYIVMEYVDGESLKARLRREGPIPLAEALRIAGETASALEAAHVAGVVHRDIKPHNVLLGAEGRVKVTDFGIARAISSTGNSDTGTLLGSVHYVSPEQARGDVVGPQSDLYSLGATLFEMLTGRPPFDGGERLAVIHKHIYDPPPDAREIRPGLPSEVASIISHCLEKDLSGRFASARELLGYLAACPRDEQTAWRPGWGRRWWQRLSRGIGLPSRPAGLRTAATAAVTLIIAVAAVLLYVSSANRARTAPVRVPDVVGMSAAAAREMLKAGGLGYREIGRRESQDIDAGSVLTQDPRPDQQVAPKAVVKVILSDGAKTVTIPNVTQMSVPQATRNLEASGLEAGAVQEAYDDHVPAGYVASTYPSHGSRVVRGTAVDMVRSLGPRPVLPPGPPLPAHPASEREETLDYTVPSDVGPGEVKVTVEISDGRNRRIIYEGRHKAGESIPTQTLVLTQPITSRVLINDQIRIEHRHEP